MTLGTNGKAAIKILSVELAEPPADGFTFHNGCVNKTLSGEETCHITMNWVPVVAGNVQNNFVITWHEVNLGQENAKAAKVPVTGNAVNKEDCTLCENVITDAGVSPAEPKIIRSAVGPDGKVIGTVDEDGYVRDAAGNLIGRTNDKGMVLDKDGNVIGVAENRRAVYDEFGNLIGYVNPDGTVVDKDGNIIGRMLPDGTVVDLNGKPIGKAVETGFVYDKDGNIIGRILPDGTVVDMNGNVIGRVNENGEVVDANGNVIGYVTKPGRVAVDENGDVLGVVMPDGSVVDANGNVVGTVDENGNVIKKALSAPPVKRFAWPTTKTAMLSDISTKTAMSGILTAILSVKCLKMEPWLTLTAMLSARPESLSAWRWTKTARLSVMSEPTARFMILTAM